MLNETLETETLETLAEKIERYANEADERTIEAAMLMRAARSRIENGELGKTKWYVWARNNIDLSETRMRELQRIAGAEDPKKELERLREKARVRVERHRKKKRSAPLRNGGTTIKDSAELEGDRQRLIAWARSAPLEHVTDVLSHIDRIGSLVDTELGEPADPVAAT